MFWTEELGMIQTSWKKNCLNSAVKLSTKTIFIYFKMSSGGRIYSTFIIKIKLKVVLVEPPPDVLTFYLLGLRDRTFRTFRTTWDCCPPHPSAGKSPTSWGLTFTMMFVPPTHLTETWASSCSSPRRHFSFLRTFLCGSERSSSNCGVFTRQTRRFLTSFPALSAESSALQPLLPTWRLQHARAHTHTRSNNNAPRFRYRSSK